ncbi:MAG: type II toxin-antitoxin system RelE/ParE family toxin [Opitutaceae bacterium]|nr:type II toxin-antitoxin system RelE/ParE family toxin [Opitutaceae bacterium]
MKSGNPWDYKFEPGAQRDLLKIGPSGAAKIKAFLDKRIKGTADPRAFGKPLRGALKGLWRYRVEDFRILCRLEDARVIVVIIAVGHRSNVYD